MHITNEQVGVCGPFSSRIQGSFLLRTKGELLTGEECSDPEDFFFVEELEFVGSRPRKVRHGVERLGVQVPCGSRR